ncbi:hypothetical protein [Microcystis aeruginosa]|nr:hypothetical protein [Microcystis aeruginosa]
MKLIEAICTDNPREVTTKYGQRLVIDAIDRTTGEKNHTMAASNR